MTLEYSSAISQFASIGPVSLLMKHELTLGHAIRAAIEYRRLLNELLFLDVRENGSSAIVEWGLIPGLRSAQGINFSRPLPIASLWMARGMSGSRTAFISGMDRRNMSRHSVAYSAVPSSSTRRSIRICDFKSDCLALSNETADQELAAHARRLLYLMPGVRLEDTVSERVCSNHPATDR